jgi:hypothetical protein
MHSHRPFLPQHRLQRYVLWLVALLSWMAAVAFADAPVSARQCRQRRIPLWRLSRWVANLIAARALTLAGRLPRRTHEWRRTRFARPSHFRRSMLGAKLRRALTHRDRATHIAQLIAILRNLDAYAAQLAQNMRRGLRRLVRTKPPIAPGVALCGAPAPTPAFSDSS